MKTEMECAVLYKEAGSKHWSLQALTLSSDVAWRSALMTEQQERYFGKTTEVMVVKREDWEKGKLTPFDPPKNLKLAPVEVLANNEPIPELDIPDFEMPEFEFEGGIDV